jgi:D-inositol-3-phosphate glycosyltransferase
MTDSRSRLKIITIGFNTYGTGLTRVMHSIMRRLADRHEIHYLGIGYFGETIQDRGLTLHPTNMKGGGDVFAAYQAKSLIEEIDPDLVFILHDIWYFAHYLRTLGPYRDRLKIVCTIPLDGRIINEDDAAPLEAADRVVVYTEFARGEFEGAFDRLREKRGGEFPAVEVIPHGVDLNCFHPLPRLEQSSFASSARAGAKRKVFAGLEALETSFIVLNASRPDQRKRVDLTIEGFARFAAGKPANVRLCLHHAIMGEVEGNRIRSLVERFGLEERIYLNPLAGGVVGDTELNLLRRRHQHVDGRRLGPRQLRARRRGCGPDRSRSQRLRRNLERARGDDPACAAHQAGIFHARNGRGFRRRRRRGAWQTV